MKYLTFWLLIAVVFVILSYTIVGVPTRVDEIKKIAPTEMESRNWEIVRYEGFQYGSWNNHGGRVWYHVKNIDNPNIQYRVYITLWNGELQWNYGAPEILNRLDINIKK